MNKKFWKTGLVIGGFFVIIGLVYYISATDFWKADQPTETAQQSQPDNNPAKENNTDSDGVAAEEAAKILLQHGDEGEAVRELQKKLNDLGYNLAVDGEYGYTTQWYVKDFQLQAGITGNGSYDTKTESLLQKAEQGEIKVEPGKAIHLNVTDSTVTNPDDLLALVNKSRRLPADYAPDELVQPDVPHVFQGEDLPYNKIRPVAAEALEQLFAQAKQEGLQLVARSGYRSYDTQVAVFARNKEKHGAEKANQYSARPGESEHQTGLVMDVTSPGVNNELVTGFEDTNEGQWLQKHAQDFGFIIRYPKGKEEITGYQYEPWHLRYVGKEAAKAIASKDMTLEEYLLQN